MKKALLDKYKNEIIEQISEINEPMAYYYNQTKGGMYDKIIPIIVKIAQQKTAKQICDLIKTEMDWVIKRVEKEDKGYANALKDAKKHLITKIKAKHCRGSDGK